MRQREKAHASAVHRRKEALFGAWFQAPKCSEDRSLCTGTLQVINRRCRCGMKIHIGEEYMKYIL